MRITGIGPANTRKLIGAFGNAAAVFRSSIPALIQTGISKESAVAIKNFHDDAAVNAELHQLKKKGIRPLFISDGDYPGKLRDLTEIPPLLFYKGNADLNAHKIVAIVGTRNPSEYGREVTRQLVRQMARPGLLIISGLALGIDAAAHRAALENLLPTIGILGHGLGHLYPPENVPLAKEMLSNGGLLTSYAYGDKPAAHQFPDRNKLIAALCDALVVVETGKKGGSMLSVSEARKYNRPIFAVPGRIMDTRSAGCNWLIRHDMATMLTSGEQISADLNWSWPQGGSGIQTALPLPSTATHTTAPEDKLLRLLKQNDSLGIDEISAESGISPSSLALLLLNLELTGLIRALPGKRYKFNAPVTHA